MWYIKTSYPKDLQEYLPSVCTEAPLNGKAFCIYHSNVAEGIGVPTKISDFIKYCGLDPHALTQDGKSKVKEMLESFWKKSNTKTIQQIHRIFIEKSRHIKFGKL